MVCLCVPAWADFDPNTRNSVAVVYTCLDLDGGEYGFGWGSGFFVGQLGQNPTYLVTNYHVIEDFVDYGQGELTSVTVDGARMTGRAKIRVYYDSRDYEEAYVVGYDSIKDIAVLKLGGATSKRAPLPIEVPTDAMVGFTVYAVGYPGLAENVFADATSTWGSSDSTVTRGTVSRLFLTAGTGTSSIQIDCEIKNGNSGGPLVTDRNTVIGVTTYSVENGSGASINYAISVAEVITLLNQYSVSYANAADVQATPATAAPASAAEGTEAVVPATPQPAPQQGGFPIWAIAVIAAVVVAGIIVAVVLGARKKQPVAAAAAPARTGSVRSLSPQHRGNKIPVGNQPVLLGRGQDCAVVYQSNTPGVSGRHCSLSWDAGSGDFILTDLQSTTAPICKTARS